MSQALNRFAALLVTGLGLLAAGCEQSARNLSLDQDEARLACQTFLTAWMDGRKVEDLKPEIIGRDYAWDAGEELVTYDFLPDEKNDGTNLHIPVQLTLRSGGKDTQSKVIYVVGTSPVVTVIRE